MKHAMAKPKKSWKERLRIFLLVLCSVVFVVSAGMLVYYLLWEPYQHNQKSVEIQQIYPTRGVEDTTSSEEVNSEGTLSKFDELRALNPDIKDGSPCRIPPLTIRCCSRRREKPRNFTFTGIT